MRFDLARSSEVETPSPNVQPEPSLLGLAWGNIVDEDYRINGSCVNESGRNFIVTLDAWF